LKNKWINLKMKKGKKSISEKHLLNLFKKYQRDNKKDINFFFKDALKRAIPSVHFKKVTRNTDNSFKEYPYVLKKSIRTFMGIKEAIKTFSVIKKPNEYNWSKKLSNILNMKKVSQEHIIQQKKYLRYRWFI